MTGQRLWTILIPTIGERRELLARLLDVLLPQLDAHGGAVRVLAWFNDGSPSLGEIRDRLVLDAGSEYVSFIDDDDLVPDYYVDEIVKAFTSSPDHIGFKLDYRTNGVGQEIVDHSLAHGRWRRSPTGLLRDFTHIDPIRREIAMRGNFTTVRPGRPEDRHWVKQVRPHLAGAREVYIDKIMYVYDWHEHVSAWQRPAGLAAHAGRPVVEHEYFSWHPGSAA